MSSKAKKRGGAAEHGPTARCEACGDLHYKRYMYADRRAKRHDGVGSRLCYECHTFISEVSDDDYVYACTKMHKAHRRDMGLNW